MFSKVLVLNRGEIACRILRTCERLGIPTVAVYSDADRDAPHVALADEAVRLGPSPVGESYLNIPAVTAAIEATGATAVHPGYGLLSENAKLARAVAAARATFVGPSPEALETFGDKMRARALARSVGVEPPPGTPSAVATEDLETAKTEAERVGYPVLVKAAGGGGGIGMQVARDPSELEAALRMASDRGKAAFGDARVYFERYLTGPRHIEVQVLGDTLGTVATLGERECSVQRRHQKVMEEAPSPASFFRGEAGRERRERLFEAARRIASAADYVGAGTVEFVADHDGVLYFLEVNARLQVEHPVTEMVTDLDLVELQLRIAAGEPLPALPSAPRGHAIEARLYAEDPARRFMPQPGTITHLAWPSGEGIRVDAGVREGTVITPYYDPLLAKIIAHGKDREEALARLRRALSETDIRVEGPKGQRVTNLGLLLELMDSASFRSGDYDTRLIDGG